MFRNKTTASLATKIAHTSMIPALGNRDLRLLQDVIINEKGVLVAMQKLASELAKASESLKTWGLGEGEDLGDIMTHSASIFGFFSAALNNYANHVHSIRTHLKTIRTREEKLEELKRRRKNVTSKADTADKKLSKMSGENKNLPSQSALLNQLRDEIRQLDTEITIEETKLEDFKRLCTRNFMALKFGGLLELGEKATIIGELGKLLIEEIPLDATSPGQPRSFYQSHTKTTAITDEVSRCIGKVVFNPGPEIIPSADAYNLAGMPSNTGRASDEIASPVNTYGSLQYPETNHPATVTGPPPFNNIAVAPTNEFGESLSPQRQFNSQPGVASFPMPDVSNSSDRTIGGGQFSTFPVKSRVPVPSRPEIGTMDSFNDNVVAALQYAEGGESNTVLNESSRKPVPYDNEEALVSYAQLGRQSDKPNDVVVQAGVRFRTPSMEASGRSPVAPGFDSPTYPRETMQQQQAQQTNSRPARRSRRKLSDAVSHVNHTAAGQTSTDSLDVPKEVDEEVDDDDGAEENPAYTHEVFNNDDDYVEEEDERERNAVAAREIAREMDMLNFPMPPPSYAPSPQQRPEIPNIPSPAVSQAESYPSRHSQSLEEQQQQQTAYPHPYETQDFSHQHQQPTITYRTPSPLSSAKQAPPSIPPVVIPGGQFLPHRTESPPIPPYSRNDYATGGSVVSNITPTPYSSPQGQYNSSLGGPRTISAAAFKRVPKDGNANRNRFLPASPRPSIDSGTSSSMVTAPTSPSNVSHTAATPPPVIPTPPPSEELTFPGQQRSVLPPALTPGRRPASPSSRSSVMDYGSLGNIRITNPTQDE